MVNWEVHKVVSSRDSFRGMMRATLIRERLKIFRNVSFSCYSIFKPEFINPRISSNPCLFIFQIMPPRSGTQGNSSIPFGYNAKGVPSMFRVYLRSHGPIPDCIGVSPIPPTAPQVPQGIITNVEFCQCMHDIA